MMTIKIIKSVGYKTSALLFALVLAVLASLSACSPDFEDPTKVLDLRVLAAAAEPVEFIYPNPIAPPEKVETTITFLTGDPALPDQKLSWVLYGCAATEDDLLCLETPRYKLASGSGKAGEVQVPVTLEQPLIGECFQVDPYGGWFGAAVWVLGIITPEEGEPVNFLKRVLVTPDMGMARMPNNNPVIEQILTGEEDKEVPVELDDEGVLHVKSGEEIRFLVQLTEDSHETFVIPSLNLEEALGSSNPEDLDPLALVQAIEPKELDEDMTYFFYTSAGSVSIGSRTEAINPILETEEDKANKDLSVTFIPGDPGTVGSIWFVVDDGHAGMTWKVLPVSVD